MFIPGRMKPKPDADENVKTAYNSEAAARSIDVAPFSFGEKWSTILKSEIMGTTRTRNRGEGMQLEIRGATVDVTTSGNTGRGVLLLHGFMCSAQMMSSVQEALCGRMRVAAIDFPGHGKNGKSAPPPRITERSTTRASPCRR